jgi:hypothetical protein
MNECIQCGAVTSIQADHHYSVFGDGCIKNGNGVSGNYSFTIFTPLKTAIGGTLVPFALMQQTKDTMIPIPPKLSLYMRRVQKVKVQRS